MIGRQSADGNQTVDMSVELEVLVPGMENSKDANACAKMPWIGGDPQQVSEAARSNIS